MTQKKNRIIYNAVYFIFCNYLYYGCILYFSHVKLNCPFQKIDHEDIARWLFDVDQLLTKISLNNLLFLIFFQKTLKKKKILLIFSFNLCKIRILLNCVVFFRCAVLRRMKRGNFKKPCI
jgi:hypothetical protein